MARRAVLAARDRAGAVAIEFALIVPLLLTLCLGLFEASEAVRADMKVRSAAQTLAQLVASQASINASTMSSFCAAAQLVMAPYATAPLQTAVASVSNTGGTAAIDWQDTTCGGGTVPGNAVTLATSMVPNAGDSVIVVQATYTYTGPVVYVLPGTIDMSQIAYARPRSNTTVPHS